MALHRDEIDAEVERAAQLPVVVAIRAQRIDRQPQRLQAADAGELHVRGVLAVAHPYPLLEARIGDQPGPDWNEPFQAERLQVAMPMGIDGAIPELVGRELRPRSAILDGDIELRHQSGAFDRRAQRRDQQPMITSGVDEAQGARRKAADAVGEQPLALPCRRESTQHIARHFDGGGKPQRLASALWPGFFHGCIPGTSTSIRYRRSLAQR